MTLLWFHFNSPRPSSTHFSKELFPDIIFSSLFVSVFHKYLLSTYYTHPLRDGTVNKIDNSSALPLWRWHSEEGITGRWKITTMKAIKFIKSGGDLCFGGKVELRQWGQETASLSPEPVSSTQPFAWVPLQNWDPVNASRQKVWAPLDFLLLGVTVAHCLMSEVDSYVFVQFSRFFYGGRASLVPGFPGGSDSKASACNAGVLGWIPVSGRSPGEGNGHPLQYSCLEDPMQRRLVGYSPWGCKELDTT